MSLPHSRAIDPHLHDFSEPLPRTSLAVGQRAHVPDYVVNVSRTALPWRWSSVALAPVEFLAVVWSVPFAILLVGIPIVLAVALLYWLGRLISNQF